MDTVKIRRNVRAQTLRLLVYLFIALLVIPLIMVFRSIFNFEERAKAVTDAMSAAENFKKDYLIVLYAPVYNITICHNLPKMSPCNVSISAPNAFSGVPPEAPSKYAPSLQVEVADPPWSAKTYLDLGIYNEYGWAYPSSIDAIEPRVRSADCHTETIDAVTYTRCNLDCANPIRISKTRHYNPDAGVAGAMIDNVSVEQGAGLC